MSRLKTNADEIRLLRRALRTAARHASQSLGLVTMSGDTAAEVRQMMRRLVELAERTRVLEADAELHLSALVRTRRGPRSAA